MSSGAWQAAARRVFAEFTAIPDEEWEYAVQFLLPRQYSKGEHLLEAGTTARHSFLLLKGLVRIYYITEQGREFISGFAHEHQFCGSVQSIIGGMPARFFIEALEDVSAVLLPRDRILELYDRHRCWDRLGRIIAEGAMMLGETRAGEMFDSLEDRYLRLLQDNPELNERIPQYHIASYLGVTGVALSRMRRRLREQGRLPEKTQDSPQP